MSVKLRYNEATGKLCGNSTELDACCKIKCDPCQMQMDLVVSGLGSAETPPPPVSEFCLQSNGTFRLRPTDTPTIPPAPGEACVTDPFTDFICFLESDPFEITDVVTEIWRWAVRIAQHENGTDWVITVAWYNEEQTSVLWWVGTVIGTGIIEDIDFCFDEFPCANRLPPCDPFGTVVCGTAVETDLSRCDFQCPAEFQLTPGDIENVTCIQCSDLNSQSYSLQVVLNPTFEACGFEGACHWGLTDIIEGAGAGCPDTIELGVSIAPVFGNGDGPPWNVFAFVRVRIDAVWHHVAWRKLNVNQLCCEMEIDFTVEDICDVSEAAECDLTAATLHLLAGALVS